MRRYVSYIMLIGIIVLFYILVRYFIPLETMQYYAGYFDSLMDRWYFLILFLYFIGYVILTALPIPGETGISLLAGFLFGPIIGTLCIVTGATLGALISFYIIRLFFRPYFLRHKNGIFMQVHDQLAHADSLSLISLRLIPVIPFFVMNYASGLTSMSPVKFALTTAIGIAPMCSIYAFAGRELRTIKSLNEVISWRMMFILLAIAFFAMLPRIIKWYRNKKS